MDWRRQLGGEQEIDRPNPILTDADDRGSGAVACIQSEADKAAVARYH
jgi:hypothetical protein